MATTEETLTTQQNEAPYSPCYTHRHACLCKQSDIFTIGNPPRNMEIFFPEPENILPFPKELMRTIEAYYSQSGLAVAESEGYFNLRKEILMGEYPNEERIKAALELDVLPKIDKEWTQRTGKNCQALNFNFDYYSCNKKFTPDDAVNCDVCGIMIHGCTFEHSFSCSKECCDCGKTKCALCFHALDVSKGRSLSLIQIAHLRLFSCKGCIEEVIDDSNTTDDMCSRCLRERLSWNPEGMEVCRVHKKGPDLFPVKKLQAVCNDNLQYESSVHPLQNDDEMTISSPGLHIKQLVVGKPPRSSTFFFPEPEKLGEVSEKLMRTIEACFEKSEKSMLESFGYLGLRKDILEGKGVTEEKIKEFFGVEELPEFNNEVQQESPLQCKSLDLNFHPCNQESEIFDLGDCSVCGIRVHDPGFLPTYCSKQCFKCGRTKCNLCFFAMYGEEQLRLLTLVCIALFRIFSCDICEEIFVLQSSPGYEMCSRCVETILSLNPRGEDRCVEHQGIDNSEEWKSIHKGCPQMKDPCISLTTKRAKIEELDNCEQDN